MDLQSLELVQATIEVKYPTAFRAFDHAGSVCENICSALPHWVLTKAAPNELGFANGDSSTAAVVDLGASRVFVNRKEGARRVEALDVFKSDASRLFSKVLSGYDIKEFSRIGYRRVYHFNEKTASNLMLTWDRLPFQIKLPEGAPAQLKPGSFILHFSLKNGLLLHFQVKTIELDVTVGHTQVDLRRNRVIGVSVENASARTALIAAAEKGAPHLPRFTLAVDLDWYKEDFSNATLQLIESFMVESEQEEEKFLKLLRA